VSFSTVVPWGVGLALQAVRRASLAGALFAVGVVLAIQVVAEGVFGTIDLLGGLFIGLGGSE
jgi:hypothetical protein